MKNQISLLIVGATILISSILRRIKLRADLIYSGSQKSEVCPRRPMPYALCPRRPMPTEAYAQSYLIFRSKGIHRLMKDNPHFNALYSQVAQQTLTSVAESLKQGRLQASEAKASLDVSDTSGFNRLESFFINSQAFAILHAIK